MPASIHGEIIDTSSRNKAFTGAQDSSELQKTQISLADVVHTGSGLAWIPQVPNDGFDVRVAVPFDRSLAEGLQRVARRCAQACPTGALTLRTAGGDPTDRTRSR